jgi:tetratricopeptide (TPR) repeat protein
MTQNSRNWLIAGIVIVILAIVAYLFMQRPTVTPSEEETIASSTDTGATSTATTNGGYTAVSLPLSQAPDAGRALLITADVRDEDRAAMQQQFSAALNTLKANPTDFNAWVAIASLRKTAGDYQGAITDWEYIGQLYPDNKVTFASEANVDFYYLKNYPKASTAYQAAIKNDPKQIYLYSDFYELVKVYPQARVAFTTALDQGIAANPNDPTLAQLKSQLSQ